MLLRPKHNKLYPERRGKGGGASRKRESCVSECLPRRLVSNSYQLRADEQRCAGNELSGAALLAVGGLFGSTELERSLHVIKN